MDLQNKLSWLQQKASPQSLEPEGFSSASLVSSGELAFIIDNHQSGQLQNRTFKPQFMGLAMPVLPSSSR